MLALVTALGGLPLGLVLVSDAVGVAALPVGVAYVITGQVLPCALCVALASLCLSPRTYCRALQLSKEPFLIGLL